MFFKKKKSMITKKHVDTVFLIIDTVAPKKYKTAVNFAKVAAEIIFK